MDRMCDPDCRSRCVVRFADQTAVDAEKLQGSAEGLNRAVSMGDGELVSETLDKSKTSNKSLCERLCGLWLIRKIIAFFKRLFCLRDVINPADGAKTTSPVAASRHAGHDNVKVSGKQAPPETAVLTNSAEIENTNAKQDRPEEWPVDSEGWIRRADELWMRVHNLGAIIVLASLPSRDEFDSMIKSVDIACSQFKTAARAAGVMAECDEKIATIEGHIKWVKSYFRDMKYPGIHYGHLDLYESWIRCHREAAEAALRVAQGNHEDMLDRLNHFVGIWRQYLAEIKGSDARRDVILSGLLAMIKKDISGIVDPLGQRNVYLLEVFKRNAAVFEGKPGL